MVRRFWDIESYYNLFCVGFIDDDNYLDMFYISDQPEEVIRACEDSGFEFTAYDLTKDASKLVEYMENPIPSDGSPTLLSNFLGVENTVVKPKEDWYFAYNSINYDIPMIDKVLSSVVGNKVRMSTRSIREFSDTLIRDEPHDTDVYAYLRYGNHVDAAFLNEKQINRGRPTVGLKTLVGVLGGSIIESESNKTGISESIYDDILYNINDIVELKDVVFPGQMETTFNTRKNLLDTYPSLTANRVTVNSTSAKFVEFIVSPDKQIDDTPTVSYMYPAPHIAEKLNVPITDILEDTKDWYMENVFAEVMKHNPEAAYKHLAKFNSVYEFYDSYRGKNWNSSTNHIFAHGIEPQDRIERARPVRTFGTILPFIDKYGNEAPSYVQFSIGGIHGAEIFKAQFEQDKAKIAELKKKYKYISKIPKGEVSRALLNIIKDQSRESYNGYPVRYSHEIPHFYENTKPVDEIVDPEDFSPYVVQRAASSSYPDDFPQFQEKIHKRYTYTSTGQAIHQDFEGYYPLLLINLGAFHDGLDKDTYQEVYDLRVALKAKLPTLEFGTEEYMLLYIEQDGFKLVLNSASGVLDGSFDTNLRANNKAISMRVIGQLMTWRIGMALALEGANIPSSNTDGIYAFNMDLERNKEIVNRELERLYIRIDPEEMFLVSKDSNNRMEIVDGRVTSARGGTLTSWQGANVSNSLAHPAIVDRILVDYLQDVDLYKPVDLDAIRKHLKNYIDTTDRRQFVYMSSWVMRSTSGSIFVDSDDNVHKGTIRVWLSHDGVTLSRFNTRASNGIKTLDEYASQLFPDSKLGNPEVIQMLARVGALENSFDKAITVQEYMNIERTVNAKGQEKLPHSVPVISETKVSNLGETTKLYINNDAINKMSEEEIDAIYENIEIEEYVSLIASFAETWHNKLLPS